MSPSPQQRRTAKASLLVIIPAFNEAESLPALLQEMQQCETVDADVLVVDDASADTTSDIARAAGVGVLSLPINLGVGGAMRTGYCYAVERGYIRPQRLQTPNGTFPSDDVHRWERPSPCEAVFPWE